MNPKQAEHRQLEAESLVEAARERETDVELMREAVKAIRDGMANDGHTVNCLGRQGKTCSLRCNLARATITKLKERLLRE